MQVFAILFLIFLFVMVGYGFSILRSLGSWNRTYTRLGKRYTAKQSRGGVFYGYLLTNPGLSFDYGRTFCTVRNRKSLRFPRGRNTDVTMNWPGKKIQLDLATIPNRLRRWRGMQPIQIDNPQFQSDYWGSSSHPDDAKQLLSPNVQWQIEQLRRLTANQQVAVSIYRGKLTISKPGYLKDYQQLDDLIRFSLELFDQLMLVGVKGIEFLNEDQAAVVDSVKCPICSEVITQQMVVCQRCKTPHCLDCWEYNGQCATFACRETRYIRADSVNV